MSRRPRIDYEPHAIGFAHNEVGALLVSAGPGPAAQHALISMLALNGLRVSEAIGAEIEAPGVERDHRTLTIVRKGGKTVTIPPRPAPPAQLTLCVPRTLSTTLTSRVAVPASDRDDHRSCAYGSRSS